MAQQQPEGIVQFYKESGLDAKGNQLVTCGRCRQKSEPDFIIDRVRMKCHIYNEHGESEIMDDPKYQSVAARFNLHRQNANQIDVGECLVSNCNTKIKSKFGKGLPFKNHSITHHTDDKKTAFFAKAVKIDSGRKILNNYKIKNTEYAKCSFCRTLISLEGLDSHPAVILVALNRHLIPHIEPEQDIPSESVPETQETPEAESSEIQSTATQSSATVENMPRQSSDDEDIPVSGETQSPLTVEPLSKQIRLNPAIFVIILMFAIVLMKAPIETLRPLEVESGPLFQTLTAPAARWKGKRGSAPLLSYTSSNRSVSIGALSLVQLQTLSPRHEAIAIAIDIAIAIGIEKSNIRESIYVNAHRNTE
ncbi:hypothetical protein G5I_00244 [Acromyrmex echinatior]|uniref:Uncharacterized protein n=1 Tax=Acromyrmex echinatior TaxID=103372 RepID=F4W4C6_ACREC|nr:hypothetical protein G5I_00244 [Acromyrmex echinatior]